METIAVVAGAPSPSLFANTLAALNALLSLGEFRLAERRIGQALELEEKRFEIKGGSRPPDWTPYRLRDFRQAADLERTLLDHLGTVEGYAKGAQSALAEAVKLIAKKKAQAERLSASLNTVATMLAGGLQNSGVYSLYVKTGGTQAAGRELKKAGGGAGHELSFCAGLAIVAASPALAPLKEILSL